MNTVVAVTLCGLLIVFVTAILFWFFFRFLLPNVRVLTMKKPDRTFTQRETDRLFDASYALTTLTGSAHGKANTDSYAYDSLNGALVPVNCSRKRRLCIADSDCRYLCENGNTAYECDQRTMSCGEKAVNIIEEDGDNTAGVAKRCDTKRGEYALLQGYNELGVAQWNCVQLYPGWQGPGVRYCEGGQVDMDVRVRVPSYLDCTCPADTTRIVYARSQLGQQIYGLPHCVKHSQLYNLGEDYLAL